MTNYTPEQRERAARQIYDMCSGDWGDMSIDQGIELQCALNAQAERRIPSGQMYSREVYDAIEAYASDRSDRAKYDAIIEAATNTANAWLQRNEVKA